MGSNTSRNKFLEIAIHFVFLSFFSVSIFSQALKIDNTKKLTVKDAHTLSSAGSLILIDIRSEQEWFQTGVASQALTISMHQAGGTSKFTEDLLIALNGNKNIPVALICASGVRSARLQTHLQEQGFTHVVDVSEGMLGNWSTEGWIQQKLPIEPYKKR